MTKWRTFIDPSVGDGQNTINGIIADGSTFGVGISDDLSVTGLSTFSDIARFSSTIRLDGQLRDGDNNFGSSGQVLSSDGTDTRWINAGSLSAGAASQVAINDDSNTNAERFITIVDSSSGNNNIKTDASLKYNPSTNTITTVNITGNVTGSVTGNASSATVLQTTRTIGGVSFNGSSNINLPGVNQTGNQNTSGSSASCTGNSATATILQNTRTIGGVSFNGSANINLPGVNQTGNQNTSGNAGSATVLETTRNFSISGEITANAQSFNGSGNVTLSATVDDNVIDEANLKISNSPTNGRFLQCNTGVSGGLTWAEVTVPAANTLTGTTLASGITASSITSLGTLTGLTVNGDISVTNGNQINLDSDSTNPTIFIKGGGPNFFRFASDANGTVDDDSIDLIYRTSPNSLGFEGSSDARKFWETDADDGRTTFHYDPYKDSHKIWHAGNDGSGSTLDADQLDGQEGTYYRNAGNLNAGTIPDARLDDSSLFVTGMILMYTGSSAPSGWAICNGQNGTPDLRDRFIVGAGNAYSVDDTGGNDQQTLALNQIPSHNHSFSGSSSHSHTINNHTHSFSGSNTHNHSYNQPAFTTYAFTGGGGSQRCQSSSGASTGNATITISGTTGNPSDRGTDSQTVSISGNTGNQGGGQPVDIRPKYYALMFIMKL